MTRRALLACVAAGSLAVATGCERETRRYKELGAASAQAASPRLTSLQAGKPDPPQPDHSPDRENAFGLSEGKRLFSTFNCTGCHAMGGGAIGPALMDDKWIYGARAEQIYSSILQGRPNGMPAFGGRIADRQIWQLVAYVQSLSGQVPQDAAPGRSDHLSATKPENRIEREQPKQTGHR